MCILLEFSLWLRNSTMTIFYSVFVLVCLSEAEVSHNFNLNKISLMQIYLMIAYFCTNQPIFLQFECFSKRYAFYNSITIYYFAKEEADRRVVPLFPETYVPIKIPFRKGLHQEFRQPSGTGIDLRFFALDDLSNPSARDDVFPIVISADTCVTPYIVDDRSYLLAHTLPQMQITQVVLPKNHEGQFVPKVVRQLLWTDDTCYELREIYGLGKSGPGFSDSGSGKECVVCMTEPKDIALLPCRHMVRKDSKLFIQSSIISLLNFC